MKLGVHTINSSLLLDPQKINHPTIHLISNKIYIET